MQAASTMNHSDIRGLARQGGPEPTWIFFVESRALYGRESGGKTACHIGCAAHGSCRACTVSHPFNPCSETLFDVRYPTSEEGDKRFFSVMLFSLVQSRRGVTDPSTCPAIDVDASLPR